MFVYLRNIALANFKNYESLNLDFCPEINCLVGDNGSGKTNLLDAIYYLSLSKSAFNSIDTQNIKHKETYFTIQGEFDLDEIFQVFCGVQKGQKKILKLNKKIYEKISEHIGRFPVVMIAPHDTDLISEGSEARRKYFDSLIAQVDPAYLHQLMHYAQVLRQRNSLLKQFQERNFQDEDLLSTYDLPLLRLGRKIYQRRVAFIRDFLPYFQEKYKIISDHQEVVAINYSSQLDQEDFEKIFRQGRQKDILLQRSNFGIHKDDYLFYIEDYLLKREGSQGQQKSFLISLKLAHFQYISRLKNFKAILLLDDIFDKLDDKRIQRLIQMIADNTFGQIFITDARPERSRQFLEAVHAEKKIFHVNQGKILPILNPKEV
ncbi:MAG: DNA replication and repair protein RecF [Microscillaceae bacterium]|nr:DNA replication and repair protein RecF [Microscillaceae bacterium]